MARPQSKLTAATMLSALIAVPLGVGVALVTLPAVAQTAHSPASPLPMAEKMHDSGSRHSGSDMKMRHGSHHGPAKHDAMNRHGHWGHRGHHGHRHMNRQLRLAEKLAGVETAIGIRSDQLDAWRDFTSKLVAFTTPSWRHHHQWKGRAGTDRDAADAGKTGQTPVDAGNAEGDATPQTMSSSREAGSGFGMFNGMVDRAIRRGDEAKALKDSMDKLKSVLTPDQIREARRLMRPAGMRHGGHHDWRGKHRGWSGGDAAKQRPGQKQGG